MKKNYLIFFFILYISNTNDCFSQRPIDTSFYARQENLFKHEIYIENLGLFIPWGTNYYNLPQYGNPRIIRTSIFRQVLSWDSIQIIGGAVVNMFCKNYKRSGEKFFNAHARIRAADYTRLKQLFISYTGSEGIFRTAKKKKEGHYAYYWTINGCGVLLGDMGKQHYYLRIEKIDKS